MEEKISIIVSSRNTSEEKKDFIQMISDTCGCFADIIFITNNGGAALSKVYHDYLEVAQNNIVVLLHDDIEFLRKGWGAEVLKLFNENKEYGIIGVAGSAEFDSRGAWWNYEHKFGQVLHRHNGQSWLTEFSPLLDKDLEEVCVIDGLFMAVNKERISSSFDENLEGFNFYDIDFCLSNFIDGKCKIGVTTNIRLAHNSIGETKGNWYENKEKINEKYKKYYPINTKRHYTKK